MNSNIDLKMDMKRKRSDSEISDEEEKSKCSGQKLDLGDAGNTMDDESSFDEENMVRIPKKKKKRIKTNISEQLLKEENTSEKVDNSELDKKHESPPLYQNQEDDPSVQRLMFEEWFNDDLQNA